jgi:diaminopimelate epimerase
MKFTKMQAFGNDYVYIDAIHQELKPFTRILKIYRSWHGLSATDILPLDQTEWF